MEVILASASPRRRDLLKRIGIDAKVIPSECDESLPPGLGAKESVRELSKRKALNVSERTGIADGRVIIGADTLVSCDGKILGKPADEDAAFDMIKLLQGRSHTVCTGVTVIGKESESFVEESEVEVYPISDEEIWEYIRTKEPMDKAGAYAIQGIFSKYIKRIKGDYSNIVGLPLGHLYSVLKHM